MSFFYVRRDKNEGEKRTHRPSDAPAKKIFRRPRQNKKKTHSLGREAATGRGTMFAIRELLRATDSGKIADHTFAIQGFGNVGAWAAELLQEHGGKIVAVSDVSSAVGNEKGLDIKALRAHAATGKPLGEFSGGAAFPVGDLLKTKCDVLIPAAIGGVIDQEQAKTLDCRFVVEAANGPTTPEGDQALRDRGIVVLPDILTNGGGVTVSFFEW